jgi:GTP-binding protein
VMADYLETRRNLAVIVVLLDSRLGFTEIDRNLLEFVSPRVVNGSIKLLVLLTKIDKLNRRESDKAVAEATRVVEEMATDETDFALATMSALSRAGVADVARFLDECVHQPASAGENAAKE